MENVAIGAEGENRFQIVPSVLTLAPNVQRQIDLGRGRL